MEWIDLYGPNGVAHSASWNLLLSTSGITDATFPTTLGAVAPDYSRGQVSFLGAMQWMVDCVLSATPVDSFLIELFGRHNDGTTSTPFALLASATYTADTKEYIDVNNQSSNEFRVVVTRTGSTDTITLACNLMKAFESVSRMG